MKTLVISAIAFIAGAMFASGSCVHHAPKAKHAAPAAVQVRAHVVYDSRDWDRSDTAALMPGGTRTWAQEHASMLRYDDPPR